MKKIQIITNYISENNSIKTNRSVKYETHACIDKGVWILSTECENMKKETS